MYEYDQGPTRTCQPPHGPHPTLYHPQPLRPAFTSSYSSPDCSSSSSSSSSSTFPPPSHSPMPSSAASSTSSKASSASPPHPSSLRHAHSLSTKHSSRPKLAKKMSSTTTKHKSVQVALEVKVEKSRGFHAFFVPLARGMPPAPPSSPVFGQSAERERRDAAMNAGGMQHPPSPSPLWAQESDKGDERWVEDVQHPVMDLD